MRYVDPMKRAATPGLCLTAVVIVMATAPASAALVGYWKLDETAGTTAADSSGNNHNGELKDGPAWDAGGVLDGAIGLDGLNDRIHVPYDVDLTYTGGDLTLSTWVYVNPGETGGWLISKPWHGSGQYNYGIYLTGGENMAVSFRLANAALPAVQPSPPEPPVPDYRRSVTLSTSSSTLIQGSWHHVAAVADTASNMTVYFDGSLAATRTNTITDWLSGTEWTGSNSNLPLAVGTLYPYPSPWAGVASHALDGKLDDVAIWSDALDATKIKSIYNVPTTLGLSYDLGDMMQLWSIHDAGAGAVGSVDRIPWQYTSSLPGTPPAAGGAYTHGDAMYVVLGAGTGLTSSVATNWVGGGSDNNWSTAANWDPAINDPNGCDLHYDNGVAVDVTKLSAMLDRDYTVAGMRLNNLSASTDVVDPNGARFYTFEIPVGITLTVSGGVNVGFQFSTWTDPGTVRNRYAVTGQFSGGGEMVINGPLTVCNSGSGAPAQAATLDVSGLSRFTIDTSGDIYVGGRNNGRGVLLLSPDNLLRATNIYAPGSHSWATAGLTSSILLGEQNMIQADNIYVGGFGLYGEMEFQNGLTSPNVVLRDYAGTGATNLYIGDMHANDRNVMGTVDFTAGSVDAVIDQLQVGIAQMRATTEDGNISATGILSMSAGTIIANSVILGRNVNGIDNPFASGTLNLSGGDFDASSIILGQDESPSGRTDRARGTINLTGGTLTATTIDSGGGEAVFNWTGGALHVDAFGSASSPIPLIQNGGTLAPGNSVGTTTVYGDYTQAAAGALQIEIAGTGTGGADFDLVEVHGDTLLAGWLEVSLLDDFLPELGDSFDVLSTSGALDIAGLQLTGDPPSPSFGWWEAAAIAGSGGEGMILRLSAVPEPASLIMMLLAMALLVARRQRGVR